MTILVTGGAGFIGRWIVKKLIKEYEIGVVDNLSNGSLTAIEEFIDKKNFKFKKGDILDASAINIAFSDVDLCIHSAAQINVQDSLENPEKTFNNNIIGTFRVLENCRKKDAKLILLGTCMVYDTTILKPIDEKHPVKSASPYAASKLATEEIALSYYYSYGLPVVILRPFNTYGPFQKSNSEGGVISIFIKKLLQDEYLPIYGDGTQTRDFLYVEDCAEFIIKSAFSKKAIGEIINAGSGEDISINELALTICGERSRIKHVPHIHPQSEIKRLVCDYSKARRILNWKPKTTLENGIKKTIAWIKKYG